jgi:hypothetical protein
MRVLWPPAEAAQADYEALRAAVLAGLAPAGPTAARFEASGLWGLIRRPSAAPCFTACLRGAQRPAWTPYSDPRLQTLADAYQLLVGPAVTNSWEETGT